MNDIVIISKTSHLATLDELLGDFGIAVIVLLGQFSLINVQYYVPHCT